MCAQFATEAVLNDTADPTFHPVGKFVTVSTYSSNLLLIRCRPFDGLGIAMDLGTIQSTSEPIVWAVGVVRDPVVQFTNSSGQIEERSSYYWSNYSNIHDAVFVFPPHQ